MTKPEGREKTFRDIACSCKVVPPRTSDKTFSQVTKGRESRKKTTRNEQNNIATQRQECGPPRISDGTGKPACAEMIIMFDDNFGASSKNVGHKKPKGNPQEQSKALDIFMKGQGVVRRTL